MGCGGELVDELERDQDVVGGGTERDRLGAAEALVLDPERLTDARLVAHDLLQHAAAAAGAADPQERARGRPLVRHLARVGEAVQPRRPAHGVVPERLGVRGATGHADRRAGPAH